MQIMADTYGVTPVGGAVMLAVFAALIPIVIFHCIRYKTLVYALLLTVAVLLEVIGHVGKILHSRNPASKPVLVLYLLCTYWGPVLVGSAIYMVLPHVTVIYGQQFRLVSNGIYLNIVFVVFDVFALILQSIGIVLYEKASTTNEADQGVIIGLTGLAIHATSLICFLGLYRYFRFRISHRRYILDDRFSSVYLSKRFRYFLIGTQGAAALLLLRAIIRLSVISGMASNTYILSGTTLYLLDNTLVLLSILILLILPAGRGFGGSWAETSPLLSPDAVSDLPFRRYLYRNHTKSHQIHNRHISYPSRYTSTAASSPFTPASGSGLGSPAELPASVPTFQQKDSPLASPLTSPQHKPVYQCAPYDQPPAQTVPFVAPQDGPTAFRAMTNIIPHADGRRKGEAAKMVKRDALWG